MLLKGEYGTAFLTIDDFEPECLEQIQTCLNHPAFKTHMVIQPDGHAGAGSIVGSTFPLTDKVVVNTIGVDIGCGILSLKLNDEFIRFKLLDEFIREVIPLGFSINNTPKFTIEHDFPFESATRTHEKFVKKYNKIFNTDMGSLSYDYDWYENKCKKEWIWVNPTQVDSAISSLGGGNHFIEVGQDKSNNYWLTVHTGSRNFGLKIANHYQSEAIKHDINNNKDLAYIPYPESFEYFEAMIFAQKYAQLNRKCIIERIIDYSGLSPSDDYIESIHNYIDFDDMVVRKGAIRSYIGERMIIPFNMRDGILMCEGKSNPEWNYSAPHGAGRVMSRNKAKKNIKIETYKTQMNGIYSSSVNESTLDEAPDAYKPPQKIIDAITPTATIIDRLKTVYNLKASGSK